jgi:hypothetical protein
MILFNQEDMTKMIVAGPRPTFNKEMFKELAILTANSLNVKKDDDDYADCIEAIEKVLQRNKFCSDGYEFGKEFEDAGFEIDSQVVSDLDCISHDRYYILSKAIEKWVITDNIQPVYKIGDKVLIKISFREIEGEIVNINTKQAYYSVKTADYIGNGGYVINYEDIIINK